MRALDIFTRIPCLLAFAVALTSGVAAAQSIDQDHVAAREALRRGEILPLSRILPIAEAAAPGDILKIHLVRHEEYGWRYRVRVLTAEGRLRMVRIDARTGRILDIMDE